MQIGLGLAPTGGAAAPFSALRLFGGGVAGALFDATRMDALWQDSAGSAAVTGWAQPVGRMRDLTGQGRLAVQSTAAARPRFGRIPPGGRRNALRQTDALADSVWTRLNVTATGMVLNEGTATGQHRISQITPLASTGPVTLSGEVRALGRSRVTIEVVSDSGSSGGRFICNLTTASLQSETAIDTPNGTGLSGNLVQLPDGWLRFVLTASSGASSVAQWSVILFVLNDSGNNTYAGEGLDAVTLRHLQLEQGPVATAPQRVGDPLDVTQTGQHSLAYLGFDGGDDQLAVTLPAMTGATRFLSADSGTTITPGQTIAAGSHPLPSPARLHAWGVINRALTPGETAALAVWLNRLRGA